MTVKTLLVALAFAVVLPMAAHAVEPDEILADPALEQRAREVGKKLRCVVCQNQSIDDSNAELAGDMRVLVRERILAGDTNEEVIAYVVDRYGDYVLLDPPFKASTYVLWIGPAVIAVLGVWGVWAYFRRRATPGDDDMPYDEPETKTTPLSDDERRRLNQILKDDA